jgi:diphthamide biosynthesis protein 2
VTPYILSRALGHHLFRLCVQIYTYDPSTRTTRLESARTNKLLQRRYYLLHAARDASVFGLLVGTLGVSAYLPLMAHLRALIKKAGRKSYTVCVGKLNPAKLGNFAEVQAWVLVACPEGSLVDSKVRLLSLSTRTTILKSVQEFPAPIVTPYELQLALAPEPEWTGRYVFDFGTLLAEGAEAPRAAEAKEKDDDNHDDEDRPHFSLVTGKFQYSKRPDSGLHGASPSDMR